MAAPSFYGRNEAPLPVQNHTTINQHARQQVRWLKLEKVIIGNASSYSKARDVGESSFLIIAGCDGRKANAELRRRQRWHTYIIYGPHRDRYAWFALPAMFGASAAEVRSLPISSHGWGSWGWHVCISGTAPFFLMGFLHLTCVGIGRGTYSLLKASAESAKNRLNFYLHINYYFYQLVVLPHKNPECINPLKRRDQLCSVSAVMARVTMFPQNAMPMVSCGHHLSQCLIDPIMGKGAIADTTSYSTVCQPY